MTAEHKLNNLNLSLEDNRFTFICPECGCSRPMNKANIGQDIECECCLEMVKVIYPENRPCPKCNQSIKLKAKVCKHCKQRVMPFVDPFTTVPISSDSEKRPQAKTSRLKALLMGLAGTAGGLGIGVFGTRAIADITHRRIGSHADLIIGIILAAYFGWQTYSKSLKRVK